MKNWKKLAAMLLAGVMALAMLTACGGDGGAGGGGSVETYEDVKTERQVQEAIKDTYGVSIKSDGTLKKLAWDALGNVDVSTGLVDKKFKYELKDTENGTAIVKVMTNTKVEGSDGKVNADSSTYIESTKLAGWLKDNNLDVKFNVGKWVNVGVAAKNINGKIFVAVAVGVNWK